ncbi:MAG: hypothetical protein ACXVEE_42830, partial [Polyangiales bacterium]
VSAVRGVITATHERAPVGTRVRIDDGGDARVTEADGYTLAWLDEIGLGDVSTIAARTVAMGLILLRRLTPTHRLPIAECRMLARALVDLDPAARPTVDADALGDDPAARALGCALATLGLAEHATSSAAVLRAVTSAALLQPLLDSFESFAAAKEHLAELVDADPTFGAEVVIAHDALRLRRGSMLPSTSLQARLVALACDEIRGSLTEIALDLDLDELDLEEMDLEEIELEEIDLVEIDDRDQRSSIELPECDADGHTTLSLAPVARILAMAHDRLLDGTLLLREPNGRRHAIVLRIGVPLRVRTHAPVKPLGMRLADSGTLEPDAISGALLRAAFAEVPLGTQLLADNLASAEAIEAALTEQHFDRIRAIARLPPQTEVTLWLNHDLLTSTDSAPAIDCDPREAIRVATISRRA